MRIGAVGKATGVPVSTLKYYLREGLLHPGELTSVNQAQYGDDHVERIRLIRALTEVGGLSTAKVKEVLEAVYDESTPIFDAFAVSQDTIAQPLPIDESEAAQMALARAWVDDFVDRHGFVVRPDAPVRDELASTLVWMEKFGLANLADPDPAGDEYFDRLAQFGREIAAVEMDMLPDGGRDEMVGYGFVGTVLIEHAFVAIRRIADEDAAASRFGTG